jgi:hypothetical protein
MRFAMRRLVSILLLAAALPQLTPVASAHEGHVHEAQDVAPEGAPAIRDFRIEKDPAGGWSAVLDTANFSFVPDDAASVPAGHVGHAHLFINGTEYGMLYEPVSHIDELPFGEHDFRVVLNNQEHAEYAITGRPIEARLSLTVE